MRFDVDDVFLVERVRVLVVGLRNRVEDGGKWADADAHLKARIRRATTNLSSLADELDAMAGGFAGNAPAAAKKGAYDESR